MIKNIIFGVAFLFFINWLFNMEKINSLQKRITEENQITIKLLAKIDSSQAILDSLEKINIELKNYDK